MALLSEKKHADLLHLIQQNRKIEAIKFLVDHTHLHLKEAKDWVDLLEIDPTTRLDDTEHSSTTSSISQESNFQSITSYYSTSQIFVKDQQGHKFEVDETHPEWLNIMKKFGRGVIYKNNRDYLEAIKKRHLDAEFESDDNGTQRSALQHPDELNLDQRNTAIFNADKNHEQIKNAGIENTHHPDKSGKLFNFLMITFAVLLLASMLSHLFE